MSENGPPDLTGTITLIQETPVASSSFSDVFRARTADGKLVAVKVQRMNATDAVKLCYMRETWFWLSLDHPHVLQFLGICVVHGRPALISPWLDNGTSREFIRMEPGADRLKILRQAGSALEYLHERGLTHGDIKGANILIDSNKTAFLADFGLMQMREVLNDFLPATSTLRNAGSYRFMAPEFFDEDTDEDLKRIDRAKTDVYAYGCTILELITGQDPFSEIKKDEAVLSRVIQGRHPNRPPAFNDDLWILCVSCWERNPHGRPAVKDILSQLAAAGTEQQDVVSPCYGNFVTYYPVPEEWID